MTFKSPPPPISTGPAPSQPTLAEGFVTTTAEALINWGRRHSLWPFPFGTACCGIEFMGVVSSHYDISRFGAELVRFSPRQSDVILIAGTVTYKQAPILRRIYDQMCEPKWVIAAGACATTGGFYDCYCTVPGIDEIIPVDIYIAGCPPRPEAFLEGIVQLQAKITGETIRDSRALGAERRAQFAAPAGAGA